LAKLIIAMLTIINNKYANESSFKLNRINEKI